jgi:PASTA domain
MPSAPISSDATIAPISGTVVSWTIGGAAAVPGYNLVVLRRNPSGKYTVTAASPVVTPAGAGAQSFLSGLPIQAGEIVGVNYPIGSTIGALSATTTVAAFAATLSVGAEAAPASENSSAFSPAFNATIESTPTVQPPVLQPPVTQPVAPAPTPEAHCVVPKLNGKKLKAAKKKIKAADCKIGLVSKKSGVKSTTGKVVTQSPKAGVVLPAHTGVSVKLG